MHISERSLSVRGVGTPRKGERTCMHRTPLLLFSWTRTRGFFFRRSPSSIQPWTSTQTSKYDYTPSPNVTKLLNMHMQLSRDSEIILPNPNLILVTISCFMLLACNFYRSYPMQREMHARLCTLAKTQGAFFIFVPTLQRYCNFVFVFLHYDFAFTIHKPTRLCS